MDPIELAMFRLAATQFGVVSRRQLRGLDFDARRIRRRLALGVFVETQPDVFQVGGSPGSFGADATAVLLATGSGSRLSSVTGAALWEVAGFARWPIHVSRPRGGKPVALEGAVVHHPRIAASLHSVMLNGLPVTTPTRTLFDLANDPMIHPKRVERAINSSWAARLTSRPSLQAMAGEWCERGRRGSAFIRDYLETRAPSWIPPATALEDRFISIIEAAGMPRPISQVDLGDAARWIGRVDCRDPFLPLIAEIDSVRFHVAPLDAAADAHRDRNLVAAGFVVNRETEFDVWHRPVDVVNRWRDARNRLSHARRAAETTELVA